MGWKVSGLSHIGLPAKNMKASVGFYEQFGFSVLVQRFGLNGFNYTYMSNGSCIIGLPESTAGGSGAERRPCGAIDHLALNCEDIEALYMYCKSKSYKILSQEIERNEIWAPRKCRSFMIEAPDGVRLEFQEMSL